jgi:HEAT repeat protein
VALPDLLDLLITEPEAAIRRRIARAVFSLILRDDVPGSIDRLARALRDPDASVRGWIVWGIEYAGPAAAPLAGELVDCLRTEDESLQRHALEALASIGPDAGAALPAVMVLVRSPSIGVQLLALKAAWHINGDRPPLLGEVLDALEGISRDPSGGIRRRAIWCLGPIAAGLARDRPEWDRAVALLRAGRSDPVAEVRDDAGRALSRIEAARSDEGACGTPP